MTSGGQDNIQWYIALSKELGRPVGALRDMPRLLEHLQPYWDAFLVLGSSRPLGFGAVGPIPFKDIIDFLVWDGIHNKDEQLKWVRYLRALDREFLKHANKRGDQ